MAPFGLNSKSIVLAQLLSGNRTPPWKCMECAALLACKMLASLAFTGVWKSDFSSLEEPNSYMTEWGSLLQSNCLLQSRGSCGFGPMPKSTRPGQRRMASVMLGLFIRKCLCAAAVKKVQSTNSNFSLWHLVSSYILTITFCISSHLTKLNAENFSMINTLGLKKSCLEKDGYGWSDTSSS